MLPIKRNWTYLLSVVASLLVLAATPVSPTTGSVSIAGDGDRDPVFVCREQQRQDCWEEGEDADGVVSGFSHYVEQVLVNEWPGQSASAALNAGAVAVRTFTDRNLGCGARLSESWNPWPGYVLRIMYNNSQRYWLGEAPNWHQNTVTSAHQNARAATDGVELYRADSDPACAKYNANCGDPTLACDAFHCSQQLDRDTLQSVSDPVAQDLDEEIAFGMAQNGTVAWERGSAPWDYRQMLTHYYAEVQLANSSDYYRWAWLNTGQDQVFLHYYGTTNPTPSVLYLEDPRDIEVAIRVQNTSRETWNAGAVKLSYRWYTTGGTPINSGPEFDTRATTTFDPTETQWVTAQLDLPSGATAGTCYVLKWDLKRGSTWFSSQHNWPTLDSTVCVEADTDPPDNPPSSSVSSSSGHIRAGWVTSTQIALDWWGAEDGETGVDGYSVAWDQSSGTTPDTSRDTTESNATSGVLGHGNWYLHVRTVDNAGNWAAGATHYGPYGIDTLAPTSVVTGSISTDPSKSWFYVEVSGSDAGSGVASYVVQYNVDGGSWQDHTSVAGPGPRTLLFCGSRYNPGHTYYFRAQATDGVGHTESWGGAEWSVYIPAGADPGGLSDARCPIMWKNYAIP